jgi:hypothetical protein
MSYSRRELYALGEPLGNSATQLKADKSRIYGGGGGDPGPTNTTVQNSNLPDYVQPYVESMLGAAQNQVYTFNPNGTVSGFKGYTPYSNNMDNYVAGFSPMQQKSFQGAANLQTPGQFGQASQMAGMAGLGSLQTAGQTAQAGNNYYGMATSTPTVNQFMNPYLQNALNPALDESRRQYGITGQQQQGNATRAGAFGGSREALMASENNRNMNTAMNQMIGTGYQNAYDSAQKNIQYGAGLGLQGQQAALQGYNQLGQAAGALGALGQQQFGAQKDIIGMQNQYGGQLQAAEQQKINQAIQNYATAQQYPMMQLGNISNLLRGLPMQSTTTQSYQAGPSGLSTLAGLGTGIAGVAQLAKAEGGTVKSYAGGGITSLANRQRMAEDLSPKQLEQVIKNGTIPPVLGQAIQQDNLRDSKAASMMAQNAAQGIDEAPTNLPTQTMAEGGIVSFAQGGYQAPALTYKQDSYDDQYARQLYDMGINPATKMRYTEEEIMDREAAKREKRGIKDIFTGQLDEVKKDKEALQGKKDDALGFSLLSASGKMLSNTSPFAFAGIGEGLSDFSLKYGSALDKIEGNKLALRKEENGIMAAQQQMKEAQLAGDNVAYKAHEADYKTGLQAMDTIGRENVKLQNDVAKTSATEQYKRSGEIEKANIEGGYKVAAAGAGNLGAVQIPKALAGMVDARETDVNARVKEFYATDEGKSYQTALKAQAGGSASADDLKRIKAGREVEDNIKAQVNKQYIPLLRNQIAEARKFGHTISAEEEAKILEGTLSIEQAKAGAAKPGAGAGGAGKGGINLNDPKYNS